MAVGWTTTSTEKGIHCLYKHCWRNFRIGTCWPNKISWSSKLRLVLQITPTYMFLYDLWRIKETFYGNSRNGKSKLRNKAKRNWRESELTMVLNFVQRIGSSFAKLKELSTKQRWFYSTTEWCCRMTQQNFVLFSMNRNSRNKITKRFLGWIINH